MPTTRPRHQVTETEDVARAIDLAARRWPDEPRSRLLLRLVEAGAEALDDDRSAELERRRAVLRAHAGAFDGVYGPGYLEELREDWPE